MSIETKSVHITPVGGNVFADLGFEPEEAAALKAESQRIISEKLAIKDSLIHSPAAQTRSLQGRDSGKVIFSGSLFSKKSHGRPF